MASPEVEKMFFVMFFKLNVMKVITGEYQSN